MRYRVVALALLVALGVAPSARAEPLERGALRLEWSAPGGCPNGVEIVERIEALLGVRVAELAPEPIIARGTVRQLETLRFELALETRQSEQRFVRSMQAPSCVELSDAGALVLALAIDPTFPERQARAAVETAAATSALPAETPPTPEPVAAAPAILATPPVRVERLDMADPRDEPPPPPAPPPPLDLEWSASLGLALDLGSVSDSSFGPRAGADMGFGLLRLKLGLLWLPPAESTVATDDQRGGAVDLVAGQAAACVVPIRGRVNVGGCAGAELGRLHGAGFGTAANSEGSTLWFGAGFEALLRGRVTGTLFFATSANFVLVPQDIVFTLENVGVVHQVPPVVGRVAIALETEFE